jgi:carboxyl-terminal processing protease
MNLIRRGLVVVTMLVIALPVAAQTADLSFEALPELSQQSQHATSAKRITALYTRSHYRSILLNDDLSVKVYERYLQQLDYNRSLFVKADIEQFDRYRLELDTDLELGRLDPFYAIFNVGQARRYEQYDYALSLLDAEHPIDFSVDESYQYDRSKAPWVSTKSELKDLWRRRVKHDALNLKLAGKTWPEVVNLLGKRYNSAIKRLIQAESEDVFQIAMNALSRSIEPHTSYLSPRNADRFKMEMNLSLEGIGAVLQPEDEYTVIRSLVPGSPADMSHQLAPDDRIVGVAQAQGDIVDIIGWRLDDVVELIKGPKGTTVRLEILPAGSKVDGVTKVVSIVRDQVRLEDRAAKGKILDLNGHKIGVLEVPSFYVNLSRDSAQEIETLKREGIDSLVVDLRGNGGGALTEATAMTGLFIENGPVVQVRDQQGNVSVNADNNDDVTYDGPLVVLVDRYSASASEIFAAALQDYGRALVIGEQTYGKGTVQQHRGLGRIYDLYDEPLGHVQYTIAKFYRINGGSTQNKGVVPDLAFPSAVAPEETGESVEDNALPWDQIGSADFERLGEPTALLASLERDHLKRIQQDPEFQYIVADIAEYQKEKDLLTISLNEKMRISQRETKEAELLKRTNERLMRAGMAKVSKLEDVPDNLDVADAYLHEAALIALEYADLSKMSVKVMN